jgi:hypothetical protein
MDQHEAPPQSARRQRFRDTVHLLAIGLVMVAILIMPHFVHITYAATPTHATGTCTPRAGTSQQDPPPICISKFLSQRAQGRANGACQLCWAGMLSSGNPAPFAIVWGQWQVPCNANPAPGSVYSMWVGLGGQSLTDPNDYFLAQTGVTALANGQYWAWVENLAAGGLSIGSPVGGGEWDQYRVNCGDTVYAEVMDSNTNGASLAPWMLIEDLTTHQISEKQYGAPARTTEAECVIEDPYGGVQDLLNFGTLTFSQCKAYAPGSGMMGSLSNFATQPQSMTDANGNILASPGPFSDTANGTFSLTWQAPN